MTTVSRAVWLTVSYLVLIAFLAASAIWMVVELRSTLGHLSWFILSVFYPLGSMAGGLRDRLIFLVGQGCYAEILVRSSTDNECLVAAMVALLRQVATHARAELVVERVDDTKADGDISAWQPLRRPWELDTSLYITRGSTTAVVEVSFASREGVVCGPRREVSHPVTFVLRTRVNPLRHLLLLGLSRRSACEAARLVGNQETAMSFMEAWLYKVYDDFMHTRDDKLVVYELQRANPEYPPTWNRIKNGSLVYRHNSPLDKRRSSQFYIADKWAEDLLGRICFALQPRGPAARSFFIHGQKGAGKTLLVRWIASELKLPLYYLDLSSAWLDDVVLREAITVEKLRHCPPVVFHVDEFQKFWSGGVATTTAGVTIHGLQSALDGPGTPDNALFIFTSSRPLPKSEAIRDADMMDEWQGLRRRFNCCGAVPPLTEPCARAYIHAFLERYIEPVSNITDPRQCTASFVTEWTARQGDIPLDMLAKYCDQRLCAARDAGLLLADASGVRVPTDKKNEFAKMLLDPSALREWPSHYAGGGHHGPGTKRRKYE